MTRRPSPRRLIPAYVVTGGQTPSRNTVDRLTVLWTAVTELPAELQPAERRVLELLRPGALPLYEVAGHLRLPVSAVTVVVCALIDAGLLVARAPIPQAQQHDPKLLERVISGLRALQ
jgi:hypothetical protein